MAGPAEQRVFGEATDALERIARADFRVLLEMPANMRRWAEALLDGRRELIRFNSTMAATFARAEARRLERNIDSGRRTAGTTENLSDALEDLKDTIQPYGDATTNALQAILASLVRTTDNTLKIAQVASPALVVVQYIAKKINEWSEKGGVGDGFDAFLMDVDSRRRPVGGDVPLRERLRMARAAAAPRRRRS